MINHDFLKVHFPLPIPEANEHQFITKSVYNLGQYLVLNKSGSLVMVREEIQAASTTIIDLKWAKEVVCWSNPENNYPKNYRFSIFFSEGKVSRILETKPPIGEAFTADEENTNLSPID